MTNTVTYYSANANHGQEWLAYVLMPNGNLWMVASFGATEDEAVTKIVNLWESERAKVRIAEGAEPDTTNDPWAVDRRGQHLKGKVWLIEKVTREKIRVDEVMAVTLVAAGTHERGGPRSK